MGTGVQCRRGIAGVALALAALSGCAWLRKVPDDEPRLEAPNARTWATLPPERREELLPPVRRFVAREWVERLVCAFGEQPGWRRTGERDGVLRYELRCPGEQAIEVDLDPSEDPPPAPDGMRLLDPRGTAQYRSALLQAEKREFGGALAMLEAALAESPGEPLYRRERVFLLWQLGRAPEALVEADTLLETFPTPLVYKLRALAARDLGMREVLLESLESLLASCPETHPLWGEAVCAKGMLLSSEGDGQADPLMRRGCELGHRACCRTLQVRAGETDVPRRWRTDRTDLAAPGIPAPPVPPPDDLRERILDALEKPPAAEAKGPEPSPPDKSAPAPPGGDAAPAAAPAASGAAAPAPADGPPAEAKPAEPRPAEPTPAGQKPEKPAEKGEPAEKAPAAAETVAT